jgi:hypothetical protein
VSSSVNGWMIAWVESTCMIRLYDWVQSTQKDRYEGGLASGVSLCLKSSVPNGHHTSVASVWWTAVCDIGLCSCPHN